MKKLLCMIVAVLMILAMLPGCGADNKPADEPGPQEDQGAVPSENEEPYGPEEDPPETEVTEETALEGVSNYCRREYGWRDGGDGSYLTQEEETETEYHLVFRSYTGAIVNFFVEKADGYTRITEIIPAFNTENEVGSFNLFDYLGMGPDDAEPDIDPVPDEMPKQKGHYVFRPKVCPVFMKELFGETMCETWYNLVDAVMAGEDTFACPDQHTYDWVMGQFPRLCFPILVELIDFAYDRGNAVADGTAGFTYLVPPEEAAARIEGFAEQIEGILNETLGDDYSDLEKALALYEYFAYTYVYDWETADRLYEEPVDYTTTYRLFKTGTGICSEIAPAYSYLLMQAGVEATIVMGGDHEWSYVRINGNEYHIDPTFVISDPCSLSYFMMTDEQREVTGYGRDEYVYISNYWHDNPYYGYAADDDSFSELWSYALTEFVPEEDIMRCWHYGPGWVTEYLDFSYAGF